MTGADIAKTGEVDAFVGDLAVLSGEDIAEVRGLGAKDGEVNAKAGEAVA